MSRFLEVKPLSNKSITVSLGSAFWTLNDIIFFLVPLYGERSKPCLASQCVLAGLILVRSSSLQQSTHLPKAPLGVGSSKKPNVG